MKQSLKNLQSVQFQLVMIYMLLIIIGMQIIGLYFTNSLERDLTGNFKNNIDSQVTLIDTRIKEIFEETGDDREQMRAEIQSLLADYGNRTEIDDNRYINTYNNLDGKSRISYASNIC